MPLTKTPRVAARDLLAPGLTAYPLPPGHITWTMNGRNAIFLGLHALQIPPKGVVLVPSFHCTALVDPILAYGARVVFYPVGRDFSVDTAGLARIIDEEKASALLCIHYFGFPAPVEAMATLCAAKGIPLLEDCSHALYGRIGEKPLGGFGDVSIFSFRKTLPVQDGGALVVARTREAAPRSDRTPWAYEARMAKWTVESLLKRGDDDFTRDFAAHAEHAGTAPAAPTGVFDLIKGPLTHDDPTFIPTLARWPISLISKWILSRSDGERVMAVRRRNYLGLEARLLGVTGVEPCYRSLPHGTIPMGFPFLGRSRARLDYRLRKAGLPAFSFGEVLSDRMDVSAFPDAAHLSGNLTILPVHQRLGEAELDRMAATVKMVLTEES